MWAYSAYVPLEAHAPAPDVAHLCGDRVVVELLDETHFAIHPSIDLRRVRRPNATGAAQREADVMLLRVRSASHYSAAGGECWIARPKLHLRCGLNADHRAAWTECLPWLMQQASAKTGVNKHLVNLARSHAAPSPDPSGLLRALAVGKITPHAAVTVRRRRIRSAVPSESGALLEQSDLEAGGRLWRSVCVEATNPSSLRQALGPVRDVLNRTRSVPPLVVSAPQFVTTVLRTVEISAEVRAATTLTPPGATAAESEDELRRGATAGLDRLSERLLDAWYESADVFNQRLYRAAQAHPRMAVPYLLKQAEGDDADEAMPSAPGTPSVPASPLRQNEARGDDDNDDDDDDDEPPPPPSPPTPPGIPDDTPPPTPPGTPPKQEQQDGGPSSPPTSPSRIPVARWRRDGAPDSPSGRSRPQGQEEQSDAAAEGAAQLHAALGAAAAAVAAGESAPFGLRVAVPLSVSSDAAREAAASGEARAAAFHRLPRYGLLALFPPAVVRRALGEAASSGDAPLLRQLLDASRGAHTNQPCGVADGTRRTPLQCASAHGHAECVELLLKQGGEASATCEGGRTALHLAASGGSHAHAACARMLLRYGAGWEQPDLRGFTPADLAAASRAGRDCEALFASLATGAAAATATIAPVPQACVVPTGGPLRYAITRPSPAAVRALVEPLVTAPAIGRSGVERAGPAPASVDAGERAWWCKDHPMDVHAHRAVHRRLALGV